MMCNRTNLFLWILAAALVCGTTASGDVTDTYVIQGTYHWLHQGDLDAAERSFLNALATDPQNADAAYFLGRVYYQRGISSTVPDEWISLAKAYLTLAEANGIVYDAFRVELLPRLGEIFAEILPAELPLLRKAQVALVTPDQRPVDGLSLRGPDGPVALQRGEPFELHVGGDYEVKAAPRSSLFKWLVAVPVALAVTGAWLTQ